MLNEVGEEIAKKCKGLPLAAKTVGGLLRFKASYQEWQDVSRSQMWELGKVKKDLFPILTLSYNELHPTVKRCFSYCAVFPKDTVIEDFEDDKSGNNLIISCKMHDIIHDFAQFLTKKECLIVERCSGGAEIVSVQNARHLNMLRAKGTSGTSPFSIEQAEKSRSCFCNTQVIPLNLFSHMKRVRSLSLRGCQMANIPREIGKLIGLRYLDLSDNPLEHLPETIYDLYYLQTLDIHDCSTLSGLPDRGIHKLINLRHLVNSGSTSSDFKFPQGFEELTNLKTLNEFSASSASGNNLGDLKGLNQLGGSLCILLHTDPGELEAKKADLKSKEFIQQLTLEVRSAPTQVVKALQPHPNLQTLVYQGRHLPTWIDSLNNLRELILFYIRVQDHADPLPSLGELPHLEKLALISWRMKHGGHDFLRINTSKSSSIFPKLKILQILSFEFWEEWEDISEEQENNTNMSIFPCLRVLQLQDCHQLKALPLRLLHKASSLQLLSICYCTCIYSRYNLETGQDRTLLSHIQCVKKFQPHY
ncbi:UNVERIFIED_CONTAM: putative disease resistance protein RGA4 [Sesamum calycinum]|uniref:Disease resistance protein RGA4 n=1 Tax=Sesamum calycinum TaxID=2727403 RepID=A0AAW2R8V3_9LAMI